MPIPVEVVLEHFLGYELEVSDEGMFVDPDCLGGIVFEDQTVTINASIENVLGRYSFTLAHEIGHHVLHREFYFDHLADGETKIICREVNTKPIIERQARQIRDDARSQLRNGIDPSAAKQAAKRNSRTDQQGTFETIAREWYDKEEPHWSGKNKKRVLRGLEQDLFPSIGSKAITSISPPELLEALRKIEARGAIETAHRTKQVAGQIFRY